MSNVAVPYPGSVTLSGLTSHGAGVDSSFSLPYTDSQGSGAASLFGGTLSWDRVLGMAVFAVAAGDEMIAGKVYQLAFVLENAPVGHPARRVLVSASELAAGGAAVARPSIAVADGQHPGTPVASLTTPLAGTNETTLSVDTDLSTSLFPSDHVRVDGEMMVVTSVSSATIGVVRTPNHEPFTLNPKPLTLDPEAKTSNPKPCTLNPEP